MKNQKAMTHYAYTKHKGKEIDLLSCSEEQKQAFLFHYDREYIETSMKRKGYHILDITPVFQEKKERKEK